MRPQLSSPDVCNIRAGSLAQGPVNHDLWCNAHQKAQGFGNCDMPGDQGDHTENSDIGSTTITGKTASAGASATKTRPTTATAVTASQNFRAAPVSFSNYNSRSSYGVRPYYLYGAIIIASSSGISHRQCSSDKYRFGNRCLTVLLFWRFVDLTRPR